MRHMALMAVLAFGVFGESLEAVWQPVWGVTPRQPTTADQVVVTLRGWWGNACIPVGSRAAVDGDTVLFVAYPSPSQMCSSVMTPWVQSQVLGPLPAGTYTLMACLDEPIEPAPRVPGNVPTMVGTFTVVPGSPPEPIPVWGPDVCLTPDAFPDWSPTALWHDSVLHVLWGHSMDPYTSGGSLHDGILDVDGLQDLGPVTSIPSTLSGSLSAASYAGAEYVFFSQRGSYPVSRVMAQNVSFGLPAFELTSGNVVDESGAFGVVYRDQLYVFWNRTLGSTSHSILYRSFDGSAWSDEIVVADDGANECRPAAAVYRDRLYLFFRGGGRYKVFDGLSWTDDTVLEEGAEICARGTCCSGVDIGLAISPTACVYRDMLYIFFHAGKQTVFKRFDGVRWGDLRAVPASLLLGGLDMVAAVRDESLYLIWTAWLSTSPRRREISAKAMPYVYASDFDSDGDTDLADFAHLRMCFNGANRPPAERDCGNTDFDADNDVDLVDFAKFRQCFNGENRPPRCH